MKILSAMAVGTMALFASGVSFAQNGSMMNGGASGDGWMNGFGAMGGYGGVWLPALLIIAVVGIVAFVVAQKRK